MKHCAAPKALAFLREELERLDEAGLLRMPARADEATLSFCSNDYLGLGERPAFAGARAGAGASRLVHGNARHHDDLEQALAEWLGVESTLLFTSGYAANVGVVSALARAGDLLVSDALNHASIIDGARLAKARLAIVPHKDTAAVRRLLAERTEARAWVVTESYFSMDADGPDLRELRGLCDEHGAAFVVDEAHALGAFGPRGRGLCAAAGVVPDVLVGTFGKALGGGGAFVGGCQDLRTWLWNRARSFVFSTGLSPSVAASNLAALAEIPEGEAARAILQARADQLRTGLRRLGIEPLGFGHIVPWVVGDPQTAIAIAKALEAEGMRVQAIRPPSVPQGTARLRLTVSTRHTEADVDSLLAAIRRAAPWLA